MLAGILRRRPPNHKPLNELAKGKKLMINAYPGREARIAESSIFVAGS
jgi:hypothetical protein